jgi:hypothetical protein
MNLYIDCEFNEFHGELISMALVSQDGREFYGVLPCDNPGPWVAEHVMPILGKEPTSLAWFQHDLMAFLFPFESIHVIADWPEDIAHFCQALITGPGMRLGTPPLTMEIRRDLDAVSLIPHNALEDARAIRLLAIEKGL